jgi:exopolysaccharide biosynthesis polyprenyl glycosylphosphotransferase
MSASASSKLDATRLRNLPLNVASKKPSASIGPPPGKRQQNRHLFAEDNSDLIQPNHDRTAWQTAIQLLLPGPFIYERRLALAKGMLADCFLVTLNVTVLVCLRTVGFSERSWTAMRSNMQLHSQDLGLIMLYAAFLVLLGYSERLYDDVIQHSWRQRMKLGKVISWSALFFAFALTFSGGRPKLAACIVISIPFNYLTMIGWRRWRSHAALRRPAARCNRRNILVIGAGELGRRVAAQLGEQQPVVGFLDDISPVGAKILGRVRDLHRVSIAEFVDEVVIALPNSPGLVRRAIEDARILGLDIKLVPDLFGFVSRSQTTERCAVPIFTLDEKPVPELGRLLKRTIDILLSASGILAALPLLTVVSAAVKLDSPGPILYRALRVGKKGNHFDCFKFRTMIADADLSKPQLRLLNQRCGAFFKLADDPRVTRIGRFLRRYSLDELPQLWNVLRGEMSLVGPRPHPLDDFERYQTEDLKRLRVTPGITGLWQVTARRDPSFQRNIALDLEYIRGWNLWMDLKILCKTVSTVLQGSGA